MEGVERVEIEERAEREGERKRERVCFEGRFTFVSSLVCLLV